MPNLALRTRDVDAFEDTSLEYVRAEMHVSKVATPRPATADVVKALRGISSDSESATISLALEWIGGAIMDASGGRMEKPGCGGVPLRGCHNSQRDPGGTSGSAC